MKKLLIEGKLYWVKGWRIEEDFVEILVEAVFNNSNDILVVPIPSVIRLPKNPDILNQLSN